MWKVVGENNLTDQWESSETSETDDGAVDDENIRQSYLFVMRINCTVY